MSRGVAVVRSGWTFEEVEALDARTGERYELVDGAIYAMSGGRQPVVVPGDRSRLPQGETLVSVSFLVESTSRACAHSPRPMLLP